MIELKHLGKIYSSASGSVEALKDVNLTIADGEIFGIIGLSGAGKSTLVRCINLLERPTSGEVWVDGQNLTALSEKALLQVRRQIGMIFQSFNLLEQRSVLRNVCFPLEISGTPKAEAKKRAEDIKSFKVSMEQSPYTLFDYQTAVTQFLPTYMVIDCYVSKSGNENYLTVYQQTINPKNKNPDTKVLVKNLFVDGDFMNRLYSLANFAPQMQDVQQTPQ